MKKLICAKDVDELIKQGQKVVHIDNNMIITPAAEDLAKANKIVFAKGSIKNESKNSEITKDFINSLDSEMLLKLFRAMMDKGLLEEMLSCLNKSKTPYVSECDAGGLKVVRGNTVKMDVFDTGDPNVKAYYQELVSKEESKMSAGFLTIEESRFEWELTYEEIDYVIEGTLTVEINGKTFTAYPGDVLFVPSGSKVVWGSPDKARVFYATYPANWADLL
ncbi:cupin domain-containing protein [Clostridium cavendishii]|uniref:cupin domain-containing protein n=1 Tax=Clostridium cavendishii TaxID=349931 RepID=UPI0009330613|nr:cupin domain-containing protein [Clostridium cavendishii]